MKSTILVLGATGKTGKRVADRLQDMDLSIRLGSRRANPSFDWDRPETWEAVLDGIEKVYLNFQPDLAVPGAPEKIGSFVDLAKRTGVQKLVLLSGRGEKEAQLCEEIVAGSSLDHTLVRASWFMQNFSESFFLEDILRGQLTVPKIGALEPFVDTDDIAEVVVAALTEDIHSGKTYELTGPQLLSFQDTVDLISNSIKRPITLQELEMKGYVRMLRDQGIPGEYVWLMEYLFTQVLDGRNESLTGDVKKVLGREPISFGEYVEKTAQAGIWAVERTLA